MLPQIHLIAGIFFIPMLYLFFPQISYLAILTVFLSTIFIDVDHYLFYVFKKGDKSLIHAYKWYTENRRKVRHLKRKEKRKISFGFHFLHGIELLILLYIMYVYVSPFFLYLLLGVGFHLILDIVAEGIECGKFNKISIIYSFLSERKLKFIDELDFAVSSI